MLFQQKSLVHINHRIFIETEGVFFMLRLNQIQKAICLSIFLVILGFTSFAQSNAEVSGHLGMKFGNKLNLREVTTSSQNQALGIDQKNMPFHFGLDAIYRNMSVNNRSFGLGLRYRLALTGERNFDATSSEDTGGIREDQDDKYKFTHNRVALLVNYRFYIDQFFVGAMLGVDIWKYLKFSVTNLGISEQLSYELTSNQFLWNQISGQLGVEAGYKVTDNLLVKLELGYDLSRFSNLECKMARNANEALTDCTESGPNNPLEMDGDRSKNIFKLDGFYATLGVGWFFG